MFVFNVFTIYTSKLPNKSMYKVKHFFVIFPQMLFTERKSMTAPCVEGPHLLVPSQPSDLVLYLEFFVPV